MQSIVKIQVKSLDDFKLTQIRGKSILNIVSTGRPVTVYDYIRILLVY